LLNVNGSVVQDIMVGLVVGGASRQVVAAAVAAVVRAYASLGRSEESLPGLPAEDLVVSREVNERLQALAKPLYAQVVAGAPSHSARGLVAPDVQVRANAAKHQFMHEKPFSQVSMKEIRRAQRQQTLIEPTCPGQSWSQVADRMVLVQRHAQRTNIFEGRTIHLAREHIESIDMVSAVWEPLQQPVVGSLVRTTRSLKTDDKEPVSLKANTAGVVKKVDDDGDMLITFPDLEDEHWIFKSSCGELEIAGNVPRLRRL
jgi:hypothetical protein